MEDTPKKPSLAVRLTAYGIFLGLILLMLVLGLEFYFQGKAEYGKAGFSYDKNLIYRLTPDLAAQKNIAWGKTGEPPFILRFNAQGFRGADFKAKADDIDQRILVMGDSYTAGLDYPDDRIYTAQWAQKLNEQGGKRYEVLNASCPAWGGDQQYVYWKTEGKELEPDVVVFLFSPNDIREMWNHKLVRYSETTQQLDVAQAHLPWKERWGWKLATSSSFFQFFQTKVLKEDYGNFLRVFRYYPVNFGGKDSTDWDMPLFLREPFEAVENSYSLYEKILQDVQADCAAMGAELHLVKLPILLEIDSTYQDSSVFSKTILEERIGEIARRNNIPYHNFNERLRQHPNPKDIFMDWEYHYDQDGHDWVGTALFEEINLKDE